MMDNESTSLLRQELEHKSVKKIELMKSSRDLVKTSKVMIYALQRGDLESGKKELEKIKTQKSEIENIAEGSNLRYYGPFINALQEFVEAATFYSYLTDGIILSHKDLDVDAETYVMGLSDLTGELMRKAVNDMVNDRFDSAVKIRDAVDGIYGVILGLDLDGGEARRKSDQVKWNLQKIEGLVFEAKIRDKI